MAELSQSRTTHTHTQIITTKTNMCIHYLLYFHHHNKKQEEKT